MRTIVALFLLITTLNCKAQSLLSNSDSLSKSETAYGGVNETQSGENATKSFFNSPGGRRKTVYLEFLGNGGVISANIETRLKPGRNDGFGIRVGVGFLTLPLGVNYIIGKKRSGFETGIGITPFYNLGGDPDDPKLRAIAMLTIGYRLQSNNGFMLRFNLSGNQIIGESSSFFPIELYGGLNLPWPGLSIGYNFNHPHKEQVFKKHLAPVTLNGEYRKTAFLEVGGNSIGFSANYDMRLRPDRNDGPGFRAGLGYLPDIDNTYITIPVGLNYIVGKRKSGLETGLGITGIYDSDPNINFFHDIYPGDRATNFTAVGVLSLGYRYQGTKGFMLRAYYTAIPFFDEGLYFFNYPGLSIGYSFNKSK
ncbi:MAG: hypothetical protein JWM28_2871 [Chitinophagaceae bacterium]|nr:hypothetical protein [Chitinophagaceae bacterium]